MLVKYSLVVLLFALALNQSFAAVAVKEIADELKKEVKEDTELLKENIEKATKDIKELDKERKKTEEKFKKILDDLFVNIDKPGQQERLEEAAQEVLKELQKRSLDVEDSLDVGEDDLDEIEDFDEDHEDEEEEH